MRNGERLSRVEIRALLEASEIEFEAVAKRQEVYTGILCQQEYWKQNREIKGLLRRYIGKMTGLGRGQVTRLIRRQGGRSRARTHVQAESVHQPVHSQSSTIGHMSGATGVSPRPY